MSVTRSVHSTTRGHRAQVLSEAVVSAYIHELAPARSAPRGTRARVRRRVREASRGRALAADLRRAARPPAGCTA